MSIMTSIGRFAHSFHAARTRYLTERSIGALPPEIRKDIGWPDVEPSRPRLAYPLIDASRYP